MIMWMLMMIVIICKSKKTLPVWYGHKMVYYYGQMQLIAITTDVSFLGSLDSPIQVRYYLAFL